MKKSNFCLQKVHKKRHKRIFRRVRDGNTNIRLRVAKTNLHFYLFVINDQLQKTLVSSSTLQLNLKSSNCESALKVAEDLLNKLKKEKINKLSLDRGPHTYHGKIAKVADFLREGGIKI